MTTVSYSDGSISEVVFMISRRYAFAVAGMVVSLLLSMNLSAAEENKPGIPLTLEHALRLVLEKNPEIAASQSEINARDARIIQANAFKNPELEIGMDNIYGNKELRNLERAETTIAISQTIELGGKRSKRTALAALERDIASWEFKAKRLELIAEVSKSFIEVVAAQKRVVLQEEMLKAAEQSYSAASGRVQAGKISPIYETKASAELASAKAELERARRSLEGARNKLALYWGESSPSFSMAEWSMRDNQPLPSYKELLDLALKNPDIARWETEVSQKQAAASLEKANRVPDPAIKFGIKQFNETKERAYIVGLSFPLPFFNMNTGAIREAEHRLNKAESEKRAVELKIKALLSDTYQILMSSFAEASTLRDTVVPAQQRAYDVVLEGYRYGKFSYADLLETQRSLFDAKAKYIDIASTHQKARFDVERLTGVFSENVIKGDN